ncbi:MAG: 30S ribosomal protein S6 [Candidatus Omnitrophica bacterium]|nr:30S ribosomal protein S6 [Candidatus Omnitrophota bacterium]
MKNYEALFVVKPNTEDEIKKILAGIVKTIEKHSGKITHEENWGKRYPAYPIKKEKEGIYYKLNFSADPLALKEMEAVFKLNNDILRVMTVRRDKEYKPLVTDSR